MSRVALALGALMLAVPSASNAATVTFEDQPAFQCNFGGSNASGGMTYTYGNAVCYYSNTDPADFPSPLTSTVMATGYTDTTFSLTDGGVFSLSSIDLAFGPFGHGGLPTDTTIVTGMLAGGGTLTTTLTVGFPFQSYSFNWDNLTSVTFGQLSRSEYLAFDNLTYSATATAAVPEPGTWALMIMGFAAASAAMRRRRTGRGVALAA